MEINQSNSIPEMMAHAGFSRSGRKWVKIIAGATYAAEDFEGRPGRDALAPVFIRQVGSFPSRACRYDTALQMATVWHGRG